MDGVTAHRRDGLMLGMHAWSYMTGVGMAAPHAAQRRSGGVRAHRREGLMLGTDMEEDAIGEGVAVGNLPVDPVLGGG